MAEQKITQEQNKIVDIYIDNDPVLSNVRRNVLEWNGRQRARIGTAAAGEIIYCIGRFLAKKAPK